MDKERPKTSSIREPDPEELNSLENIVSFGSIRAYINSLPQVNPHTYEDDKALASRVENGDTEAASEMFSSVARWIACLAVRRGMNEQTTWELISEGNLAVWARGISGYKPEKFEKEDGRRVKFITYATSVIRNAQSRFLRRNREAFNVSEQVGSRMNKVNYHSTKFLAEFGREPDLADLVVATGLSPRKVREALELNNQKVFSFDSQTGDEGDLTLGDIIIDDTNEILRSDEAKEIEEARKKIIESIRQVEEIDRRNAEIYAPSRYGETLRLRIGLNPDDTWGEPLTAKELAKRFGITVTRASQIQIKAVYLVKDYQARTFLKKMLLKLRQTT